MRQGFIFDHNRCVACSACVAACMLENGWKSRPRNIYIMDQENYPDLPVLNISMACNHCLKAVCMEGCPASAYARDETSGAVLIDSAKCIGCRYCQWNCPYDAPKYLPADGVINKCNLCVTRLLEGLLPACSSSCPTGALQYGNMEGMDTELPLAGFPGKDLSPAVRFTGKICKTVECHPELSFPVAKRGQPAMGKMLRDSWSLAAFTFLAILAVAAVLAGLVTGNNPGNILMTTLLASSASVSLLHLGTKKRAWRSVLNFRTSPLSREIILFLLFTLFSLTGLWLDLPLLVMISGLTGLIFLLSADEVYRYAENGRSLITHSGQAFLTALLAASFLSGKPLPFAFIATIKLLLIFRQLLNYRRDAPGFTPLFMRAAALIISGISLITGISYPGYPVLILFIAGELTDRILFYMDFRPVTISDRTVQTSKKYETQRN